MRIARRSALATAGALGLALATLAAPSASAETTETTFTLQGGSLSISVPAAAELQEALLGAADVTAQLGVVTVTDSRGELNGEWHVMVSSTDFTTDAEATNNTIPKANVSYMSGLVVGTGGLATVEGTGLLGLVPVVLDQDRQAAAAESILGAVSATWNPTVTVTVPNDVVAGDYIGTITHSVA